LACLGGEERFEGPLAHGGVHACAGIAHREFDVGPVLASHARCIHADEPLGRNRIAPVQAEVEQDLLELDPVDAHGRHVIWNRVHLELDSLWNLRAQQPRGIREGAAHVDYVGAYRCLAGEREQRADQASTVLGRIECRVSVGVAQTVGTQQVRVAQDRRELIVDVMRDATGERAQRFHSPRLEQDILESAPRTLGEREHLDHQQWKRSRDPKRVARTGLGPDTAHEGVDHCQAGERPERPRKDALVDTHLGSVGYSHHGDSGPDGKRAFAQPVEQPRSFMASAPPQAGPDRCHDEDGRGHPGRYTRPGEGQRTAQEE